MFQNVLVEVSSKVISFQIELHLLLTWVKSSDYFKIIESLRTCIIASHGEILHLFHLFSTETN